MKYLFLLFSVIALFGLGVSVLGASLGISDSTTYSSLVKRSPEDEPPCPHGHPCGPPPGGFHHGPPPDGFPHGPPPSSDTTNSADSMSDDAQSKTKRSAENSQHPPPPGAGGMGGMGGGMEGSMGASMGAQVGGSGGAGGQPSMG
ncbi:uncharacterized protein LOC117609429 [Osmia lignaria lignaria]|uniref:uncharacterized protein LOC117609429 n=1 Tax=Osmia lignaria lignaria TaxID=1437193 RepID=UPI001478A16F|nr:histidine-rich glycoprotein-like [Osmia lignaria]